MAPTLPAVPAQRMDGPWEPIFSPKDYVKSLPKEGLEECRLNEKTLIKLGKEVTKHRRQFELLADRLANEVGNLDEDHGKEIKR